MSWSKEDNSSLALKAFIRRRYLSFLQEPAVLDLFCGAGEMYRRVYAPAGVRYFGVDNTKIHDPSLCVLDDNVRFVNHANISEYNFFDLDDYGCPWKLLYLICKRYRGDEMVCAVTDGLPLKITRGSSIPKILGAVEGIGSKMKIPGLWRFYVDMFGTMLRDIERRYGFRAERAEYAFNPRGTVCYWGLYFRRPKNF